MIGVSNSSSRRFGVEKKNGDPMTCAASPVVPFYNKKSFFFPKIMFFQTKIKLGNGSATGAVDVGVYRAVFALIFFTFFYALIFVTFWQPPKVEPLRISFRAYLRRRR